MLVNIPANVGGLEHQFYFPRNIGKRIIPIDELHHFSEGWLNHQAVSDNPTWWFSSFPLRSTMIWGVSLGRPRRALRSQVRARWDISCERIMQVICETHVWRGYWVGKIFYLWFFFEMKAKTDWNPSLGVEGYLSFWEIWLTFPQQVQSIPEIWQFSSEFAEGPAVEQVGTQNLLFGSSMKHLEGRFTASNPEI